MADAPKKAALHYSMLSMLSKCGMQAYYRYVEGVKAPPGVALVVGTAVHQSAGDDLVSKMQTGSLLSVEAVEQRAAEALDATWAGEGVILDAEDRARGEAVVRGEAKDEAVTLSRLHHEQIAPAIEPIAIERKMRLELVGFPFDLEGSIDVETADTIRDRKTAKKSPSGGEVYGNPQLETYAMMASIIDKAPAKSIALDFLVKTKTPKAVSLVAPPPADFDAIKRRIELAAKVFETGSFYPVDPTGPNAWVCTRKFCGFFDRCPFGARRVKTIPMNTAPSGE